MAVGAHPIGDAVDSQVFGDERDVQDDAVAGGVGGVDEFELGGMGEDGLGDERPSLGHEGCAGVPAATRAAS